MAQPDTNGGDPAREAWVEAVMEVRIPIDVDIEAPDEEIRKEAEAAFEMESVPPGVVASVRYEITTKDHDADLRLSSDGISQRVPNVQLLRFLVENVGWAFGKLNTDDALSHEHLGEIAAALEVAMDSAGELSARLERDAETGASAPDLQQQLERMLQAEDENA